MLIFLMFSYLRLSKDFEPNVFLVILCENLLSFFLNIYLAQDPACPIW